MEKNDLRLESASWTLSRTHSLLCLFSQIRLEISTLNTSLERSRVLFRVGNRVFKESGERAGGYALDGDGRATNQATVGRADNHRGEGEGQRSGRARGTPLARPPSGYASGSRCASDKGTRSSRPAAYLAGL